MNFSTDSIFICCTYKQVIYHSFLSQRRSFHFNRVIHVSQANTFQKRKIKFSRLISCFIVTPYNGTQQELSDKMHR
jgi:hypothetical protein